MSAPATEKPLIPERWWALSGMLALLVLALWAYWPGLHGPFLFDDFGTLPALGANGPVRSWPVFWRYVTSGGGDPTGRPLALLSFLIDARNWPAPPYPFKLTNLVLELANGALLATLLWRLGRTLEPAGTRASRAAVLGAALWLLHPLLVSTTLYVVQREAMLAAFFVMLGLLAYIRGRRLILAGHAISGLAWTLSGLVGCTLLATLSKANGALLPILALVLEATIFARSPMPAQHQRLWRTTLWIFAVLPALLLFAYLLWTGVSGTLHPPPVRRWTEPQRLLTEPRVLFDYLKLLWLPRPFSTGLFNDAFTVSRSLWHPADTLPSLLGIIALIATGWRLRVTYPTVALAILFYFAGMALESTTIPLELYFEHRNYLPAIMMFWPLAWWLSDLRTLPGLKATLSFALPLLLALLTLQRATLWGHADAQALYWARINPDSPRAQAYAAQFEASHGHAQAAQARFLPLLDKHPDQIQLAFNLLNVQCQLGGVTPAAAQAARTSMATMRNPGTLLTSWFDRAIDASRTGQCKGFDLPLLQSLVQAGLDNQRLKSNPGRQQDLLYLSGRLALARGNGQAALDDFEHALAMDVRPDFAAEAAAQLGSANQPQLGLRMLDDYRRTAAQAPPPSFGMGMLHAWVLQRQDYWPHELGRLHAALAHAAQQATH